MKIKIALTATIISTLLFSGCTNRLTDFTVISSKNVDLSEIAQYKRGDVRATGEDAAYIIIFIPTGIPNLKEAIDRAIESVPGAVALVDGVVYMTNVYIPFVFGVNKYTVEGTPLIKPSKIGSLPSKNIVVSYNSEKDIFVTKYYSDSEFAELKKQIGKNR